MTTGGTIWESENSLDYETITMWPTAGGEIKTKATINEDASVDDDSAEISVSGDWDLSGSRDIGHVAEVWRRGGGRMASGLSVGEVYYYTASQSSKLLFFNLINHNHVSTFHFDPPKRSLTIYSSKKLILTSEGLTWIFPTRGNIFAESVFQNIDTEKFTRKPENLPKIM